jgi:flagellar assembly protein FliH
MSSKILTGDAAKSAVAINWSKRGSMYESQPDQPSPEGCSRASNGQRSSDPALDALIAEAKQAGRAEAEATLRTQISGQFDAINLRLARSIEELSSHQAVLRRDAEQDVVKLAIAIARKVLYREISVDPEALLGLVKVALEKIEAREIHRVRVHPDQTRGVEHALQSIGAPRQIEVYGDPGLEHGAAIFETSRGSLDVSVETQLREIERGFADLVVRR